MLTLYVRTSADRLEIGRGEYRAQFELRDNVWVPTWMRQGDRRMLRFKDHQWLAIGHLRPKASDWEILEDSADRVLVRFWGEDNYFGVPVEWSTSVAVEEPWRGFTITTEIVPAQRIEVVECFSRFETPYEYDGQEEALSMVGQNPVTHWRGGRFLTRAKIGQIPTHSPYGWLICRLVPPSRTPICCLMLKGGEDGESRFITVLGHWSECCFRSLCVCPTQFDGKRRAYELLAGVLDWRCSSQIEPNVVLEGGRPYRQAVSIMFSSEMPGGSLDRWFFAAFERSLRQYFPSEPSLEADRRSREKGVSLAQANSYLLEVFTSQGVPGLYSMARGMTRYIEGSSPQAGHYSLSLLAPWIGAVGYQAYATRREDLAETCQKLVPLVARAIDRPEDREPSAGSAHAELLPLLRYLACYSDDQLHGAVRRALGRLLEAFPPESGEQPDLDLGTEAIHAEAFFLAGQLAGDKRLMDAAFACLERVNAAAGDRFWRFGCAVGWEDLAAGGQARPVGYGHAIMANLIAYQRTHREQYMEMAGTFARYLLAICFATFNDSADSDFDTRGFANGAIAGLDRLMECSPVETSDSLRAVAYWLSFRPEVSPAFYDVLWLFSRTFCGVFPVARSQRQLVSVEGRPVVYKVGDLPTAIAFQRFPYIAYENPVRQIRQSPRASVEALLNYLAFGGGLASCDNDRLLVLVPRAAGCDLAERVGRLVYTYNPTQGPERTRLSIHHLPPHRQFEVIKDGKRVATGVKGSALEAIELDVPPRQVVRLEIVPARQPSSTS